MRDKIEVDAGVLLALYESLFGSVVEMFELTSGAKINDKAKGILREGINKTWGEHLGLAIDENWQAVVA